MNIPLRKSNSSDRATTAAVYVNHMNGMGEEEEEEEEEEEKEEKDEEGERLLTHIFVIDNLPPIQSSFRISLLHEMFDKVFLNRQPSLSPSLMSVPIPPPSRFAVQR